MRSIRNQPFCWQEKKVLRRLRAEFHGAELVKMRALYGALTEIDSDFNGREIQWYTKTIATYSGLSRQWIPSGLRQFVRLGVIQIPEDGKGLTKGEGGRFVGKTVTFTPDKMVEEPVDGKPTNGESTSGETATSEDSSYSEDSSSQKNIAAAPPASNGTAKKVAADTRGFTDLWREYAGTDAILTPANYANAAKLLKQFTLADLRPWVAAFHQIEWWFTKDGRAFGSFYTHLDEVIAGKGAGLPKWLDDIAL